MIEEHKENIIGLKNKLNALDPHSDDLEFLFKLQLDILQYIVSLEEKIAETKENRKEERSSLRKSRLSKPDAKLVKDRIIDLDVEIKNLQKLIYIYKCFGDGILFKYISKWNLKRFLYEVDSSAIKSDAGSLSNKDGLKIELAVIYDAITNRVPAILNDLTNVIRHGDVCLLGASDPYVIEVKSSKNQNKRIERQISAINKIHDYLSNDVGDIGGFEDMRRVDINSDEIHFNHVINELTIKQDGSKLTRVSPEEGIYYIAIDTTTDQETDYESVFANIEKPIPFLLNTTKNEQAWGNYYPFTLSIKSPESLYQFINGDIFTIVIIDFSMIEKKAAKIGFDVELVSDGTIGLSFSKKIDGFDEPFKFAASDHYFCRIAYEFLSLEWFFNELTQNLKTIENDILSKIA